MPRKRTASFSGAANAALPSLSVEGGGTESWNTPTAPGYSSTRYDGFSAVVDGSNNGFLGIKYNLPPTFAAQLTTSTGTTSTWTLTTDAATYLFPNSGVQPSVTATDTLLFAFQTSAGVQHYHQIDLTGTQSTGCWSASTFTKVADQGSLVGGVYYRHTIWVVTNLGTGFGRARLRVKDVQGATTYTSAIAPTGGGGTGTNNVTATAAAGLPVLASGTPGGLNGVNSANTVGASGTGTTSTFTLDKVSAGNFARYNNVPFAALLRLENAIQSGNADIRIHGSDNLATPTTTFTVGHALANGTTDATRVNPTFALSTANSVGWSGAAVEIKDSAANSNSYFTASSDTADGSISAVMLAGTTNRYSTIVKSQSKSGETQSQSLASFFNRGLVARYCTVSGTDYWVSLAFNVQTGGKAFVGVGVVSATGSSLTALSSTSVALQSAAYTGGSSTINVGGDLRNMTLRVRPHSAGGLWIDAKIWDSAVAEPAWPVSEPPAAASNSVGTASNSTTSTTIVMSVNDRRAAAVTIAANPGKTGVSVAYGATAANTVEGTYYGRAWSAWEDDDVVIQIASSDLSGAAGLVGSGDIVVPTGGGTTLMAAEISPSSEAVSDLIASATVIAVADATRTDSTGIVGTGDINASGIIVSVADATTAGAGNLTSDYFVVGVEAVSITLIESNLSADSIVINLESANLAGTSTFESVEAVHVVIANTTLTAITTFENVTAVLVFSDTATLSGTSTLTGNSDTATLSVDLAGTGTIVANSEVIIAVSVLMSGASTLTCAADTAYSVTLSGFGVLSGGATLIIAASANLAASSDGTCAAVQVLVASSELNGSSGGTSIATHVNVGTATLSGVGAISSAATHVNIFASTISGSGAIAVDATHVAVTDAACIGTGALSLSAMVDLFASTALAGASGLVGQLVGVAYTASGLTAVGQIAVAGKAVHPIPDTLRNTTSKKLGGAFETIATTSEGEPLAETATLSRKVGTGILSTVRELE